MSSEEDTKAFFNGKLVTVEVGNWGLNGTSIEELEHGIDSPAATGAVCPSKCKDDRLK